MKIVQIMGPSYSGSTALGYMLNTADGWFFGSEIYRALKSFRDVSLEKKGKVAEVLCDFCGKECPFGSESLKKEIFDLDADSLNEVYSLFSKYHPSIEVFVDGSKSMKWYQGNEGDWQIVSAKHPIRLVASHLYNNRYKIGFKGGSFEEFSGYIDKNINSAADFSSRVLRNLRFSYESMLDLPVKRPYLCKVDEMHVNNF